MFVFFSLARVREQKDGSRDASAETGPRFALTPLPCQPANGTVMRWNISRVKKKGVLVHRLHWGFYVFCTAFEDDLRYEKWLFAASAFRVPTCGVLSGKQRSIRAGAR